MSQSSGISIVGLALLGLQLILSLPIVDMKSEAEINGNKEQQQAFGDGSLMRKSIVFDLKTPKVFYCPQEKPADLSKMIVKARPLDRLCEFQGQAKPRGTQSDCFNDVDETEFACDEKRRFMVSGP